jgi:hypothetical protein
MRLISPTGLGIRNDAKGLGHFGAKRGYRIHQGVDFECKPGQDIVCPVDYATILREAIPYANDYKYRGLLLCNDQVLIKMFYCELLPDMVGATVVEGQVIAKAQNIAAKYGKGMIPHIHLQIDKVDPMVFMVQDGDTKS